MRLPGFLLLLLLCSNVVQAQGLYDAGSIQEIRVTFYQNNWDHLLDSLKAIDQGDYLLVQSVEINGQMFDSCGVKYKGNSSYNDDNAKNPLHIELDFVRKSQNYQGYEDVKLSNCFADPTFVREALSYEILRQYMDAPQANHAKLWLNGTYFGVYTNVESINKRFVKKHFYTDGNNPFVKCNPEDFAGPGTGGNYPDLVYSSADSAFYYNKYDMRSDYGWRELLTLMDTLKNHPAGAEQVLDVDRVLWMLAFNNTTVNLDSYTGAFAQNYYLYLDENNRFVPVSWDLNMNFGAFPLLSPGGSGMLSLAQMKQMDPLIQSTNNNRPLIKQLLANPTWKRMYLAHLRTILEENFSTGAYAVRAVALQSVISSDVQNDTKKFYSFTAFQNNVNQTINNGGSGGFSTIPGLTDLMDARSTFLNSNSNITPEPPVISNITTAVANTVQVNALIQNSSSAVLAWRFDTSAVFQKTPLFDDGQHHDGAAGDGVFGGDFPINGLKAQYYIYAENAQAGRFAPARAEHEFFSVSSLPPLPNAGDVVINEFLADNGAGATDEARENEDWLELYNNTANPVNLTGLYLTDKADNPTKWPFPAGVSIPGNGFLIVWLDEDQLQGPYHANFKLGAGGEFIMLSDGAGTVLDSLSFGPQQPDISFGRYPNGVGPFTFMPVTFDDFNSTTSTQSPERAVLRLVPNPASDACTLQSDAPLGRVQILDRMGRLVQAVDTEESQMTFQVRSLPAGMYTVRAGGRAMKLMVGN